MVSITKYLFRPGVQLQFWVLLGVKPRIELTVGNFSFAPATTTSSEDHPSVYNLLLSEHSDTRLRIGNISFVFHISHYWGCICNINLGTNKNIEKKTTRAGTEKYRKTVLTCRERNL